LIVEGGGTIPQAAFLAQAAALAAQLPPGGCALNLCESRGAFMLGFAAALLRGHTSLLPPDKSAQTIAALRGSYASSYVLSDQPLAHTPNAALRVPPLAADGNWNAAVPQLDGGLRAVIAFTSGSTGRPAPHARSWAQLCAHARLVAGRFGLHGACVVATVPPQHAFGLEATVMPALACGVVVHSGRPFFAQDVALALAQAPAPRVLVTTPVHLDALVRAGLPLPALRCVLSATAPLPAALAAAAEDLLGAPVFEMYGSTESAGLASRRTVEGELWLPLPGVSLRVEQGIAQAAGPHLEGEVPLADHIEPADGGRFRLLGRAGDLLKVAGKRMSLADLGLKLRAIAGVEDAAVFMPAAAAGRRVARPAALVVAPGLSERHILEALAAAVDPAFLPRPLRCVARLPRNELGKLPQAALERMLRE
jgi:acyl-coenzyme A synthetase/AMP-(fatty) acid ligase